MNTISLVTVEVGNLRLVWRFSGIGGPRLLPPPPCCPAITMALSLFAREKQLTTAPPPQYEGRGKEGKKMTQLSPSRERPRSHTLDCYSFPTGQNPVNTTTSYCKRVGKCSLRPVQAYAQLQVHLLWKREDGC